jgi:hypothetical protein
MIIREVAERFQSFFLQEIEKSDFGSPLLAKPPLEVGKVHRHGAQSSSYLDYYPSITFIGQCP